MNNLQINQHKKMEPDPTKPTVAGIVARFIALASIGVAVCIALAIYLKSAIPLLIIFVYLFVLQRLTWYKHPDSRSGE